MAIEVRKNSWHARLYRWWYNQKYSYGTNDLNPEYTNLCPYMRAVLFWSWMRWVFIGGKIGRVRVPFVTWAFLLIEVPRWLGMVSYNAKQFVLFMYGLGIGTAIVLAFVGFLSWLDEDRHVFDGIKSSAEEFTHLTGEYLRAKHDRICPEITFKG